MTRILVVDNYDSFVYTIVGYLTQLGAECVVHRNDTITVDTAADYDGVLISPGPGTPEAAGVSIDMIRWCADHGTPMLGVCLGHQALAVAFGGVVSRAPELLHGKTSPVHHNHAGVFSDLPSPFIATRYHSLAVVEEHLPTELQVHARTPSGVIMGIAHRELPLYGVQFHPESVLTEGGHALLATWLSRCGLAEARHRAESLSPLVGGSAQGMTRSLQG
ncbi:Anthranilate synthase component 2 [Austwickia sp. TVS 96-490-7B]|uniref:aminodeoxychorismate/anthranilate synthase component II n=1 Tax=Austwickia sp. TVS 96-490-7B TaxID=2830843 RepID=UPI001C562979|nr:aminodeoxychorismate/anthranilate synthase component II [Austwickia sp. TVS 96-490-7B]MBW3084218.1 Anthranilate synthase component 2 [Austwickia sp. TVS 96-490-7B]